MIVHILCTPIRESNRVGSSDSSCPISRLSSIESRARVVISNCIGVSVGIWLIRVDWGMDSMSKNRAMGNSNRVSYCMSYGMSKSMSKQLWSSRSNSNNSSKTDKGLHDDQLAISTRLPM